MTDSITQRWALNAADEYAIESGCKFDEAQGQFVVDWIESYCILYEGEFAGQKMELRDWQYEATMRMFGWMKYSEKYGRWVRRFRQTAIYLPKKNAKSPTLAAWGLYLLCGDGERGQKVFLAAKDGSQAREIAGKHAIEMLVQSESLMSECSINRSLMQITHEPSRSILKPLSSSNSRTKEAKEGLNGSILIDETHVVDWDFVRRINRAGISRSEPFQIEVSTAGNNPDGYGKDRFDYAQAVERGEQRDEELFVCIYAAPQDVTDETIHEDPIRLGRLANPKFGHILDEDEFLKDYERSRRSIGDFAEFKMYRLNIWQRASNPWLSMDDWNGCRDEFTEADMLGRRCFGGLDLSKTKDMTAFVLVFPDEDETFYILPWFWLPEDATTDSRRRNYDLYRQWSEDEVLMTTPGNTLDYSAVRKTIAELNEKFDIVSVGFDPRYADFLVQQLVEEDGMYFELHPQNNAQFAEPTDEFERLVLGGSLRHNNNPILNWQIGHAEVKTDHNNYRKPVKNNPYQKIDGVIAGIMALAAARDDEGESAYEHRGVLELDG